MSLPPPFTPLCGMFDLLPCNSLQTNPLPFNSIFHAATTWSFWNANNLVLSLLEATGQGQNSSFLVPHIRLPNLAQSSCSTLLPCSTLRIFPRNSAPCLHTLVWLQHACLYGQSSPRVCHPLLPPLRELSFILQGPPSTITVRGEPSLKRFRQSALCVLALCFLTTYMEFPYYLTH